MVFVWFWLVAIMIVAYVVLDGFDLGAGVLHLLIAKTDEERRTVIRTIGPVWDGNEVWLLAGGGTLYFAFRNTLCQIHHRTRPVRRSELATRTFSGWEPAHHLSAAGG